MANIHRKSIESISRQYPVQTAEEEAEMVGRMLSEGKESELRDRMVFHNIKLVGKAMAPYRWAYKDLDDAWSVGIEKLMDCSRKFDFSMKVRFNTFAMMSIRRAIRRDIAERMGPVETNTIHANQPVGEDEEGGELFDLLHDKIIKGSYSMCSRPSVKTEQNDIMEMIGKIAKRCHVPPRTLDILKDRYIKDMSVTEIAMKYKITKQAVSSKIAKCLSKMRCYVFQSSMFTRNITKTCRDFGYNLEDYWEYHDKKLSEEYWNVFAPPRDST